jgi:signal transduction histidine kinase/CheY-like chemotaxis protein
LAIHEITLDTAQLKERFSQMEVRVQQLQSETISLAIPFLFILGIMILADTRRFPDTLIAFPALAAILGLSVLSWFLRGRYFLAASIILVLSYLGIVWLVLVLGGFEYGIFLLIIPVGIATLTLGIATGVGFALTCSVLFFFPPLMTLAPDEMLRITCALCIWATVGMIWLTLRPLLTTVEWAWNGYEQSLALLDQSREFQSQLLQVLEDLKSANSQLIRLNRLANDLRQEAEAERTIKQQFVANVSHELRTPLNMIVGFCETILNSPRGYGGELPPMLIADLEVVLRNGMHLSSLIDDVLELSQIDAGQMVVTKEPSDFGEILESVKIAVRPLFESKSLFLNSEIQDDLPLVVCDRTRIREVLLNLLSNAGRFTDKGGITIRVLKESNHLLVAVTDTGPGIPENEQGKLFQPFSQLDGSIRRRYGGTGLGLSISKSFVELHDGKMWVESEKGNGATFYFTLPFRPILPLESGAGRWVNPYTHFVERGRPIRMQMPAVKPRLVVLDQGRTLTRMLGRFLENSEVVQVKDLDAALAEVKEAPSRALFVNHTFNSEITQKLSLPGVLPFSTPAIICAVPGAAQFEQTPSVIDYLVKPVSKAQLLEAIDKIEQPVKTILLVDDEPDLLQLFRRMLVAANRGYRVLRASDGRQALAILKRESVDLVLLDLVMPEMDGVQFLEAKAKEPYLENLRVILISALDPNGQPVVCNSLAVTRGGGLSASNVLACFDALIQILAPGAEPTGTDFPGMSPG